VKEAKREERRRRWRRLTHGFGNMLMNGTIRRRSPVAKASTPRDYLLGENYFTWGW